MAAFYDGLIVRQNVAEETGLLIHGEIHEVEVVVRKDSAFWSFSPAPAAIFLGLSLHPNQWPACPAELNWRSALSCRSRHRG